MNKMIFPNELLIEAVTRAREIETEYYEWEIEEQDFHRFSRKYQRKINELRNAKVVHHISQKRSLRFKVALVAVIVMLMGSMTILAVSPRSEKMSNFIEELFQKEPERMKRTPTKTEVYHKREEVLAGMSEDEIQRLLEKIKALNLDFEHKYIYENCFEKWSDPNDLYWNYIENVGQIAVGWKQDPLYVENVGITAEEWEESQAQKIYVNNDMDATRFIQLIAELKESMKTDLLDADFNNLVNNMRLAKETHEVEYLEEVYYILHDMDYYLFRYGPEDVAVYMVDDSTVVKYYGVLEVYQE